MPKMDTLTFFGIDYIVTSFSKRFLSAKEITPEIFKLVEQF